MANIHYAPAGSRAPTHDATQMILALAERHDVVVHADAQDYERLAPRFHGHPRVAVRRLPGPRWQHRWHGAPGGLRARLTAVAARLDRRWRLDELRRRLASARVDLVLHEDDGLLAEAARRAGLPRLTPGEVATPHPVPARDAREREAGGPARSLRALARARPA